MAKSDKDFVKEVTPRTEDYSQWYLDVILKAEMMDYAPVKGCMVIRPYGYSLWENMQKRLDKRFKETGHKNAYFPLFIPESLLQKEAEHVEGFAPEVAWVTQGGNDKLTERLVVRPTSEAIICAMYARWIQSWRDLPILLNQWCNVVRWEKVTRPFLRTSEFLWQEGHTAHRTEEEAEEEARKMLAVYVDFVENDLAIPVVAGRKTEREKFAGALRTYSIEALMSDGKALQAGTSHNLGQHFAKVFDITFLDQDDQLKYVWQSSWGVSTRLIGAIIMVHGDDRGLCMPPKVAPIQVVIVPIITKKAREEVLAAGQRLLDEFSDSLRIEFDDREGYSPGWKYNEWEMKGVPLRMEIGPRDLEKEQVVLVRRDTGEKEIVPRAALKERLPALLEEIQDNMLKKAKAFREENTHQTNSYEEFKKIIEEKRGFIIAHWCGDQECEEKIKAETKATIRCIPFEQEEGEGKCIYCGEKAESVVYFARAY
ncbi:MAG: proline--tRNA ligase [Dethiobacteria bacterium]|jgi:prolyl-tRNA synthetase|nr:proline--tRNA ligase [Bacillota bacterium]